MKLSPSEKQDCDAPDVASSDPFHVNEDAVARQALRLAAIMARLRAPGGCPWDREQTPESLKKYAVEEVYEFLDALDGADDAAICEELGDVLLQVFFHAQMARERRAFSIEDVFCAISDKLVERHPHVFGDVTVSGVADVLTNWEIIKKRKSAEQGKPGRRLLDGVPRSLPALLQAFRIAEKTNHAGVSAFLLARKVEEDVLLIASAVPDDGVAGNAAVAKPANAGTLPGLNGDQEAAVHAADSERFGMLLLDIARLAARLGVDPEEALRRQNKIWIDEVNS